MHCAAHEIFSLRRDLSLEWWVTREGGRGATLTDPCLDPQRGPDHIIGVLYAKDAQLFARHWSTCS